MVRSRFPEFLALTTLIALGALFSPGPSGAESRASDGGLVLHLSCNGDVRDHSGLRHRVEPRNVEFTTDKKGNPTGAIQFSDAKPGQLNIGGAPSFNGMKEFTLSAWVCPDLRREHLNVFSKVTPYRDFNLQIDALGRPLTHIMANGYEFCYAKTPIPVREWSLVTATFRDRNWRMYINGRLDSSIDVKYEPRWVSEQMNVGALEDRGGENFSGKMDDLRIYNRALTAGQVKKLFQNGPS